MGKNNSGLNKRQRNLLIDWFDDNKDEIVGLFVDVGKMVKQGIFSKTFYYSFIKLNYHENTDKCVNRFLHALSMDYHHKKERGEVWRHLSSRRKRKKERESWKQFITENVL